MDEDNGPGPSSDLPEAANDNEEPPTDHELAWLLGILREHFARTEANSKARQELVFRSSMALLGVLLLGAVSYGAVVLSRLAVLIERTAAIVEKLNNARESSRTPNAQQRVERHDSMLPTLSNGGLRPPDDLQLRAPCLYKGQPLQGVIAIRGLCWWKEPCPKSSNESFVENSEKMKCRRPVVIANGPG